MEEKTTCGISAVIKATGMRRKDIIAHIETGRIKARMRGRQLVFDISEKDRLESLHVAHTGFFHAVNSYLDENSGFSIARSKCREEILEFAAENAWFGAEVLPANDVFFTDTRNEAYFVRKDDEYLFSPKLRLWLASYGESHEGKLRLLLGRLQELYPVTETLLGKFFAEQCPEDYTAAWILTDFLCSNLRCEIMQADDKSLDYLAESADRELPLNSARMFPMFLSYLRRKRKLGNGWSYQFQSRGGTQEISAYPATEFIKMAYAVFNEEAWEMKQLKEKALQSEKCANLWVFIAFHFICGWRGSDIVRLPMPNLPCGGAAMRERLSEETLDSNALLEEVEMCLRYSPMKPNKTKSYNVPELKLFVAESLRKPLGFILAAAASHHEDVKPGGMFIRRAGLVPELLGFFGAEFVSACGNRSFSTRRANKSYLQGIESCADNNHGKPKGYMLAALARSHKSGYGTLPRTTEIYLRDARFSGYSPEFIAREMFERGVFSFIPALLLDMYEGSTNAKLPVPAQTELMAGIGISPSGLEGLASIVQGALVKARNAVAEIMERPMEIRGSVEGILQNIASGNAPGRQDGILCLMTAAGHACKDPDRSCCIGCGFEIYTKAILRLLMSEYTRLLEKKNAAHEVEATRCEAILKKAVLPAISEILLSAQRLFPDADMNPLIEEIKRGV